MTKKNTAFNVKPICVIYFPENMYVGDGRRNWIYEYMKFLNGEKQDGVQQTDYYTSYYWFCFYKPDIEAPEFQVFHEKEFTEVQYQELKALVESSISSFKNDKL